MPLPSGVIDREQAKFKDVGGEVAVKVAVIETVGGGDGATEATLSNVLTELGQKTEPADAQNIRALTFAGDKVDASGSVVALDGPSLAALENISVTVTSIGEVEINNDAGNPIPVSGAFYQATQPVSIAGSVPVTGPLTDAQLRAADVPTKNLLNSTSSTQGTISVTSSATAVRVGGSNLTNRKNLTAYNDSNSTLYWGYTSGVTTATGIPLAKGQALDISVGDALTIYLIASSGSNTVRVAEGA